MGPMIDKGHRPAGNPCLKTGLFRGLMKIVSFATKPYVVTQISPPPPPDHTARAEVAPATDETPEAAEFLLDRFLPYQLAVLSARISDGFADIYTRRFGISVAEWRVLAHLSRDEKVSIREIHRRVRMDKSKSSRAAARLERAGYVLKRENPCDRRLVELSLTETGRALVDQIAPLALAYEADILERLDQEERRQFRDSIVKLLDGLR